MVGRAAKQMLGTSEDGRFPGLQTASGKKVDVSAESLSAVKQRLGISSSKGGGFPGLQTASGKKVNISAESLSAVKQRLGTSSSKGGGFPGLQTASGKKVEVSKESLRAAKQALQGQVTLLLSGFTVLQLALPPVGIPAS